MLVKVAEWLDEGRAKDTAGLVDAGKGVTGVEDTDDVFGEKTEAVQSNEVSAKENEEEERGGLMSRCGRWFRCNGCRRKCLPCLI